MKRLIIIGMLLLAGTVAADFLGIKKGPEYIALPVHPPLDSAGIPGAPDSIQVVTYSDNGATKAYGASGSGYGCAGIDTTSDFGRSLIWFVDQIQDIDGGGGNFELAIQVITWSKKLPTYTFATVQVITDSLNVLAAMNDSLEHLDNWVSSFKPATDSVMAKANIVQVSDDAAAANNLELAWDGSADHSVTLSLRSINIQNSTGSALIAASTGGNGHGMSLSGYGTGRDVNADFIDSLNATVASRSAFNPAADSVKAKANVVQMSAAAVAAIWNAPQAGYDSPGTFGYNLDQPISSISAASGNGAWPVTIVAGQTGGGVVPGAEIAVHNLSLSALMAYGVNNAAGEVHFNLDTGRYIVAVTAPGYIFPAAETLSVAGSGSDTIWGAYFDPGSPASPNLCRVYGFIYGIDGMPLADVTVEAQLADGAVRYNGVIISPYRKTAVSDSAGYFFLDVIPSTRLTPDNARYVISATYPAGMVLKKKVMVPDEANWRLTW